MSLGGFDGTPRQYRTRTPEIIIIAPIQRLPTRMANSASSELHTVASMPSASASTPISIALIEIKKPKISGGAKKTGYFICSVWKVPMKKEIQQMRSFCARTSLIGASMAMKTALAATMP
eukprot:gnl/TRDRNA2_/TRDRNA2_211702_c0_seq1.p3 gnl/TRDRNA2_/TRDRNA2_211702_c0~~gnl/TRDRNA2_/TRDRNA2_211702_c0_seq1.p3  ORF type:complete len:120 (+),score=22.58 gnl/TRDRNA2_/TRDRNA2_211702_c0_seq1:70-429(+)